MVRSEMARGRVGGWIREGMKAAAICGVLLRTADENCRWILTTWQRLIDGKYIQPQDLVLLQHEYLESNLMKMGYTQKAAHDLANEQFNYWDVIQKNLHD